MSILNKLLIIVIGLGAFAAYEIHERLDVTPENVIITGTCQNLETSDPVIMVRDQLMVVNAHPDKYEGIIRKTGEQVICPVSLVVYEFGKYRNLPEFLRPKETESLVTLRQIKVEDNGIKELKNKNVLVSGTCQAGDKTVTFNQEPTTVLNTERIKGKYYLSMFVFATSAKVNCLFTDISVSAATDMHIEKAKLKVMNPGEMIGKTLLLTGICSPETVDKKTYLNLINARVKVIDVEFRNGSPVSLRAGVIREDHSKIVNCGGTNGKFVLEPYISVGPEPSGR